MKGKYKSKVIQHHPSARLIVVPQGFGIRTADGQTLAQSFATPLSAWRAVAEGIERRADNSSPKATGTAP